MTMKKLNVAFAGMFAVAVIFSVVFTGCNEGEEKVKTVTESTTTDTVIAPMPDTVKMDTAAPMPVKTTN